MVLSSKFGNITAAKKYMKNPHGEDEKIFENKIQSCLIMNLLSNRHRYFIRNQFQTSPTFVLYRWFVIFYISHNGIKLPMLWNFISFSFSNSLFCSVSFWNNDSGKGNIGIILYNTRGCPFRSSVPSVTNFTSNLLCLYLLKKWTDFDVQGV